MIRQAVGAIIRFQGNFILVHKVKIMDITKSPQKITGEWDFVKGGVKTSDKSKEEALFRELLEETGSTYYRLVKEFSEKLRFTFPKELQQSDFFHQETTMFLVDFLGTFSDLTANDQEIDQLALFSEKKVCEKLTHLESREFFQSNIVQKERDY